MNHQHYLRIARECSQKSTYSKYTRVKVGCILVYKNTILAKGWNTEKTHTDQMHYNAVRFDCNKKYFPHKLHAEQMCLSKVKYLDIDFSKVILYVYREYNDGSPALAKPCLSCEKYINDLQVGKIVYTTDSGYAIEKFVYNKNKKKKKK